MIYKTLFKYKFSNKSSLDLHVFSIKADIDFVFHIAEYYNPPPPPPFIKHDAKNVEPIEHVK